MQKTVVEDELNVSENIKQAKYSKANLEEITKKLQHLYANQQIELMEVLKKHESAFAGTRGRWNGKEISLELKEGAKL